MDCDHIDEKKALEAIRRTRETGKEHAFAVCSDGTHSEIVKGSEKQVDIDVDCDGTAGIFHVHPNDVMHLSDQDLTVLSHDAIDMVCVGDTQGNMKCEIDGEDYACVSDMKQGREKALGQAQATYETDDGDGVTLALLPKGSRCIDYKSVPSRSSYHNSDEVDRCDKFGTPGEGKKKSDDSDESKPEPDDDDEDDDAEPVQELGDGPVTLDTSDWNDYVIPAVREMASIAANNDNATSAIKLKEAADTLDNQGGETRSLEDQTKGDWGYVVRALDVISDNAESDDDAEKLSELSDSIRSQVAGDSGGKAPPSKIEPPEDVAGWELYSDSDLHAAWRTDGFVKPPATVGKTYDDPETTVEIRSHAGRFKHKFEVRRVYEWEDDGEQQKEKTRITDYTQTWSHTDDGLAKNWNMAMEKAVAWMKDNPAPEPEETPEDDEGVLDGEPYPENPNGWEHIEDIESFEGASNADVVMWYRPAINESNPTQPYEYVTITDRSEIQGSGSGYSVETERGPHPTDTESVSDVSGGHSLMPKKSTGYGRYKSVSASRAIDLAVEHMEKYDPKDLDYNYAPDSLSIRGEARQFRYVADQLSRAYEGKGSRPMNVSVSEGGMKLITTDAANVLMGIFTVQSQGYESWSVSKQARFSVKVRPFANAIRDANITDEIHITVEEWGEGAPPKIVVYDEEETELGYAFMLPEKDRLREDKMLPDMDDPFEAGAKLKGDEFRKAYKWTSMAGPLNGALGLRSDGDVADLVAEGDVDAARAVLDEDPTGRKAATWYSEDYIQDISIIPKPSSTTVHLQWSDEFPLQQVYGRGDDYYRVEQWLAPRISGGDDDDGPSSPWDVELEQADVVDVSCPFGTTFGATLGQMPEGYTESSGGSLRRAWAGYKIAISEGDEETAKQYASVINGIRAANGDEPIEFDKLDGFTGIDKKPGETMQELGAPRDVVLWFHPKAEGCRCSSQAVQIDQFARNHDATVIGVNTESEAHNAEFVEAFDLSFPVVSDDGTLVEMFDVETDDDGRPERTMVFVRDGQVTDRVEGMFGGETLASKAEDDDSETMRPCGHSVEEPPEILETFEHPSVVTITGKRRSGKSSLAYYVAEEMYQHESVPPVTVNVPDAVADQLPEHWTHVSSIRNAPNNAVIVYDEAYRSVHSRTPMSDENLDLTEIVELSAQRGQTLLFVTQNSAILDKVAVGESDLMMLKEPGKLSMHFERPQIRSLSEDARERFEMLPESADKRGYVYVYGEDGETFIENEEANFYDDDISRSFAQQSLDEFGDCGLFVR